MDITNLTVPSDWLATPDRRVCGAPTADGTPCQLPASQADGRCHHHTDGPPTLDDRDDLPDDVVRRLDRFQGAIWHNREVCNHCFARVRRQVATADLVADPDRLADSAPATQQERTSAASKGHTPWQPAAAYHGVTFCEECGSDLTAGNETISLNELTDHAKHLYRYTSLHTPVAIDPQVLGASLARLKGTPENTGYSSEIVALAWSRATSLPPEAAGAATAET